MNSHEFISPTPWDTTVFGVQTWEILEYSEETLGAAERLGGHFSIKVDPTVHKALLQEFGYYYCDTLLLPYCTKAKFRNFPSLSLGVTRKFDENEMLKICHGAFRHGRYHRDFQLTAALADVRYDSWLKQMIEKDQVYGLFQGDNLAGFIAYQGHVLVLHAVSEEYRGMGLSKHWWSLVIQEMFQAGHAEVSSSVSASNVAVLNLYISLGFSFRKPVDVYHKLVQIR